MDRRRPAGASIRTRSMRHKFSARRSSAMHRNPTGIAANLLQPRNAPLCLLNWRPKWQGFGDSAERVVSNSAKLPLVTVFLGSNARLWRNRKPTLPGQTSMHASQCRTRNRCQPLIKKRRQFANLGFPGFAKLDQIRQLGDRQRRSSVSGTDGRIGADLAASRNP